MSRRDRHRDAQLGALEVRRHRRAVASQRVPDQPARHRLIDARRPRPPPRRPRRASGSRGNSGGSGPQLVERGGDRAACPARAGPSSRSAGTVIPGKPSTRSTPPVHHRDEVHAPVVDALAAQHQLGGEGRVRRRHPEAWSPSSRRRSYRAPGWANPCVSAILACMHASVVAEHDRRADVHRRASPASLGVLMKHLLVLLEPRLLLARSSRPASPSPR